MTSLTDGRSGRQLDCYAQPSAGPRGEGKGSIVCADDAFNDCQAKTDTRVVIADAFGAALERFGEGGDEPGRERHTGVLDGKHDVLPVDGGGDPDRALSGVVVDDAVVQEVGGHLQQ